MSTPFPQTGKVERKWYVVDLSGKILGRAATRIARILKGKNKAIYTPHMDTGDYVVVINAEKVRLTGKKMDQKVHFHHSGWPGGAKFQNYREMISVKPEKALTLAVKGMLPKNSLGRKMIKKLHVYAGEKHEQTAQKPEKLEI
jgi:large subunit ribosomal protein L13